MRVVHLTSVHARYDTRIFLKECCSLVQQGFQVSLIVADGRGDEVCAGVEILDVGLLRGRLKRIFQTTQRIFQRARQLNADLYHFHDPELLPVGLRLRCLGKQVIFDAHEDVPKQLLTKPYLNSPIRHFISWTFARYERYACRRLSAVVAATPTIRDKYQSVSKYVVDINNYPILGELSTEVDWTQKKAAVCYIGGISRKRGAVETVEALAHTHMPVQLLLAGKSIDPGVDAAMRSSNGWSMVQFLGFLDRSGVRDVLTQSMVGLVTLHPTPNYLDALPIKMFEYMSAGIPVIASNFPLWRSIVESSCCGICVDPLDATAIARAIDELISNPQRAAQLGRNGQRAVQEHYNWTNEARKLIALYESLLNQELLSR